MKSKDYKRWGKDDDYREREGEREVREEKEGKEETWKKTGKRDSKKDRITHSFSFTCILNRAASLSLYLDAQVFLFFEATYFGVMSTLAWETERRRCNTTGQEIRYYPQVFLKVGHKIGNLKNFENLSALE